MRSTWNEDLYTTKLDKSKSRITMEEANRLAAEIEAAARAGRTSNHHLVEERGIEVDGADEARWHPVHQAGGVRVWVKGRVRTGPATTTWWRGAASRRTAPTRRKPRWHPADQADGVRVCGLGMGLHWRGACCAGACGVQRDREAVAGASHVGLPARQPQAASTSDGLACSEYSGPPRA